MSLDFNEARGLGFGMQWHQLDHMQTICISLQTDNHTNTNHSIFAGWMLVLMPNQQHQSTHTHTCLTALCPGLPRSASTKKVKPIWILLKHETVSGSGKSAPCSRQTTTPAPHHSVFYRLNAVRAEQTNSVKALKAINSVKALKTK